MVNSLSSSKNKLHHLSIIDVVVLVFGILISLYLILKGIEANSLSIATAETNNKAYIISRFDTDDQTSKQKIIERLNKHHGEDIGTVIHYDFDAGSGVPFEGLPFDIIDVTAAQDFITEDLAKTPEDKIPILTPEGGLKIDNDSEQLNWLRQEINNNYYIVGELPGKNTATVYPILVDDGSGKVSEYITNLSREWVDESTGRTSPHRLEYIVARFDNPTDLLGYSAITTDELFRSGLHPYIADLAGNPSETASTLNRVGFIFVLFAIVLVTIAVIVIVVILSRNQKTKNHSR